ncbi:MAG: dTDP-4-dehydrorhamnose 3,5-epimerase family protein [Patescibacteria group bacterium]
MNYSYLNLESTQGKIDGVILRKLVVHKDPTGSLVETLREDWQDVFNPTSPFKMQYMSITPSKVARDEDKWHVHKHQKDRFICASGKIVTAVFDPRENSPTNGKLNLFTMGPNNEEEMYMIVIPQETYHGFMVVSTEPGYLLNFPTQLYNSSDEGRIENKGELNWQKVREDFG